MVKNSNQTRLVMATPVVSRPAAINTALSANRTEAALITQRMRQLAQELRGLSAALDVATRTPDVTTSSPEFLLRKVAETGERLDAFRKVLRPIAIRSARSS